MLLIMAVSLYTSRIILNALGVEDFGIYNVVGGVVMMFVFLNGTLGNATSRFITIELGKKDFNKLNRVFRSAFTIHLLLMFIILLLAETIGLWLLNYKLAIPENRLFAANVVYQISVISCCITITQVPLNASIIAHERMNIYAYLGVSDVLLKLIVAAIISQNSSDKLIIYAFLLFIISVGMYCFYHIYCKTNFKEYSCKLLFDKDIFKDMLSFSSWSLFGSLAYVLKDHGVNIVLNIFFGPSINASRGIAMQVSTAVSSFSQNFTVALNPQIYKAYASKEYQRMISLLFKGAKFSFFLLLFFATPIILEAEYLLRLWLGSVPNYAVLFTRLVIVNSLLETYTYTIGASVQATAKIKWYQIFVGSTLLLNLPITYLFLTKGYEPQIAFIIAILLTVISLIIRVLILNKLIYISIKRFILDVFGVTISVTLLSAIIPSIIEIIMQPGIEKFITICIVSFISTASTIWIIGLSKSEKFVIIQELKNKYILFYSVIKKGYKYILSLLITMALLIGFGYFISLPTKSNPQNKVAHLSFDDVSKAFISLKDSNYNSIYQK